MGCGSSSKSATFYESHPHLARLKKSFELIDLKEDTIKTFYSVYEKYTRDDDPSGEMDVVFFIEDNNLDERAFACSILGCHGNRSGKINFETFVFSLYNILAIPPKKLEILTDCIFYVYADELDPKDRVVKVGLSFERCFALIEEACLANDVLAESQRVHDFISKVASDGPKKRTLTRDEFRSLYCRFAADPFGTRFKMIQNRLAGTIVSESFWLAMTELRFEGDHTFRDARTLVNLRSRASLFGRLSVAVRIKPDHTKSSNSLAKITPVEREGVVKRVKRITMAVVDNVKVRRPLK